MKLKDGLKATAGFAISGDFCTFFPDKISKQNWRYCCFLHDKDYEKSSSISRLCADKKLYRCVKAQSNALIASIMYVGVRVFGIFYYHKK